MSGGEKITIMKRGRMIEYPDKVVFEANDGRICMMPDDIMSKPPFYIEANIIHALINYTPVDSDEVSA